MCCVSKVAANSITLTVFIYLVTFERVFVSSYPAFVCVHGCFLECLYSLMRLLVAVDSLPYVHEHIREPTGKEYSFPLTHNGLLLAASAMSMQQTERERENSCCDGTD